MKKVAITAEQWNAITPARFENLALKHVADVYPDVRWVPTRLVKDDGKDAVGERSVANGVSEIYWMEAKHKPKNLSIGKYTLDTHLVSVVSGGSVKRLHVVTSGRLSANFILRANSFAQGRSFTFSYSDARTLQEWLRQRPDCVRYFGDLRRAVAQILAAPVTSPQPLPAVICSSFILPEDDAPSAAVSAVGELLPGRKYQLLIAFSPARCEQTGDVVLQWRPDPVVVGLLRRDISEGGLRIEDITATPIVAIPFRLLRYANAPFTPPVVVVDGEERPFAFAQPRVLPRLISPFAGHHPMEVLAAHTRTLTDVREGRPRLVSISGRAGSGKSRLAEELRDEAQNREFAVKMVRFERGTDNQREIWRLLFRWIFGLEDNLFSFKESDLLEHGAELYRMRRANTSLLRALSAFLIQGAFVEELFNRDTETGRLMADALVERLKFLSPILLHIDDAHQLSPRLMAPLYLLRHIVESRTSLPLFVLVTSRDDETVIDRAIDHFTTSLAMSRSQQAVVEELRDLDTRDAEMLVADTLQWPELRSTESAVSKRIIERAGTNPFSLMQVMTHIAVDKQAVAFGHGKQNLLVDVPAFKEALASMPTGIRNVLRERFDGLSRMEGGEHLLEILTVAALLGRESDVAVIDAALSQPLATENVRSLLSQGYLSTANKHKLVLSHDLMTEGLLREGRASRLAQQLALTVDREGLQKQLGDDRLVSIYFKAGPPRARETWEAAVRIIRTSYETEDYRRVMNILPTIQDLQQTTPSPVATTYQFRAAIAGVHQHCGNTLTALTQFVALMNDTRQYLGARPTAAQEFADSACEAGNQSYLRLELTKGFEYLKNALHVLSDDAYEFDPNCRRATMALAHNRMAAILQLVGDSIQAESEYRLSMEYAGAASDQYLVCHCLTDIGVTLRQRNPSEALAFIRQSRAYWQKYMPAKERRRIMIDCSEQYSLCLIQNDYSTRSRLLAVASEAAEKGYLFQAADAILCMSYCAITAGELEEGADAALKALNLSALSEDMKSRLYAYQYLTVTAAAFGAITDARDYQAEAERWSSDAMFAKSSIRQTIGDAGRNLRRGPARLRPHPFAVA